MQKLCWASPGSVLAGDLFQRALPPGGANGGGDWGSQIQTPTKAGEELGPKARGGWLGWGWTGRVGCFVWMAEALWGFSAVCQPLTDDKTLAPSGGEPVVVCVAPTLLLGVWVCL